MALMELVRKDIETATVLKGIKWNKLKILGLLMFTNLKIVVM